MIRWQRWRRHLQHSARSHRVWQPVGAVRRSVPTTPRTENESPQISATAATGLGRGQVKHVKNACLEQEASKRTRTPKIRHCVSPQTLGCSCGRKRRESPCDLAKYIQSASHFSFVISNSHRCTSTQPQAADFKQVWSLPPFCCRMESRLLLFLIVGGVTFSWSSHKQIYDAKTDGHA